MEENVKRTKITLKESWRVVYTIFRLYYQISPARTVLLFVSGAITGLRSFFYAFLFAKTIDKIMFLAQTQDTDFKKLFPYFGILIAYAVIFEGILGGIYSYCRRFFRVKSSFELDKLLYRHINTLGIQTLENPHIANLIQRSQQWLYDTLEVFMESVNLVTQVVRSVISGGVIVMFAPTIVPIFLIFKFITFIPERYFNRLSFNWYVDNSEERRKRSWIVGYLSDPRQLQEINIVGAFKYLSQKIIDFYQWYHRGILHIVTKREIVRSLLNILGDIVILVGYSFVFMALMVKRITVGIATFQMSAIDNFSGAVGNLLGSIGVFNDLSPKMTDLIELMQLKPAVPDGTVVLPRLQKPPSIDFKNISFRYPNSDINIFENLDLSIQNGEKIAIVGENGAGKTTLIKLIARLYSIQHGEILINGTNLSGLKIDDWYKNIGILFQDFNGYVSLTARENILLGKPMQPTSEERIIEAAKQADAHEFISRFKHGYDEILSERFKNGTRPSTGQWQKIAIARMFYRDAPLLIFDEPTASIDAVSEYKIFNRIYEFFKNKTVIIVSHRFSTVRNADRIIVLSHGKIIEQGTHNALIKRGGTYANAFTLQAEGYQAEK